MISLNWSQTTIVGRCSCQIKGDNLTIWCQQEVIQHNLENSTHLVHYCSINRGGHWSGMWTALSVLHHSSALWPSRCHSRTPSSIPTRLRRFLQSVSRCQRHTDGRHKRMMAMSGGRGQKFWEGRGQQREATFSASQGFMLAIYLFHLSSLMAISMAARLQNRDVFCVEGEPTIRLSAASRKRLWPVVPFTASFFLFFYPAALTLIDGDSFSRGHPAGFHLDAAIIKGQYTERLCRIGEERRNRRKPEDLRRLSSQVPAAEWASRRSTAFHQPGSTDRWLGVDTSRGGDNKQTSRLQVRARRPEREPIKPWPPPTDLQALQTS